MGDPIDSSSDLREQMEEFDRAELEADDAGFDATVASAPEATASRRSFPQWVIWMIVADVIIGVAVAVYVFSA